MFLTARMPGKAVPDRLSSCRPQSPAPSCNPHGPSPPYNILSVSVNRRITDLKYLCLSPITYLANGIGKPVQLNLYTITIKDRTTCNASYGWRSYDFSSGAMNFFAPGQVHRWEEKTVNAGRWGWMLAFHPDFLRKYPLGAKIGRLKFFSYDVREALHISDMERDVVENIMENIESEYKYKN